MALARYTHLQMWMPQIIGSSLAAASRSAWIGCEVLAGPVAFVIASWYSAGLRRSSHWPVRPPSLTDYGALTGAATLAAWLFQRASAHANGDRVAWWSFGYSDRWS
jgi:hypothetical protein